MTNKTRNDVACLPITARSAITSVPRARRQSMEGGRFGRFEVGKRQNSLGSLLLGFWTSGDRLLDRRLSGLRTPRGHTSEIERSNSRPTFRNVDGARQSA